MISIPHFWDNVVLDPNYSVLLGDNVATVNSLCKKSNQVVEDSSNINKSVIIGVVVGVVGGVLLFSLILFVLKPKIQLWRVIVKDKSASDHAEFPVELTNVNSEYISPVKISPEYVNSGQ